MIRGSARARVLVDITIHRMSKDVAVLAESWRRSVTGCVGKPVAAGLAGTHDRARKSHAHACMCTHDVGLVAAIAVGCEKQ